MARQFRCYDLIRHPLLYRGVYVNNFLLLLLALFLAANAQSKIQLDYSDENIILSTTDNNFGSNPTVIVHDDFESGAINAPLANWSLSSSHGKTPVYTNNDKVTGIFSAKADFSGGSFNSTAEYKSLGGISKVYVSYYFKVSHLSGAASRNIKLGRLSSGYQSAYIEPTGLTFFPTNENGIFYTYSNIESESKTPTTWLDNFVDSQWHRAEYLLELSSPAGSANGKSLIILDGIKISEKNQIVTEELGNKIEWFTLPYYVAHDPGGDYLIFYDNVVVSKNPGRVEVCDKDTYSSCKKPTIIQVSNWENDRITIPQDRFLKGSGSNLYIFNQSGQLLNSKGIHACPKCPKPPET